jgi:anti-sigma B factor antagonist
VRPNRIEVRQQAEGETLVLSVEGELDLGSIPILAQQIDTQIGRGDTKALTLDLSDVTFMDSSGLRMLIELSERAHGEEWRLALIAPTHESASLVLRMTGADSALPFEDPP